MNWAQHLIAFYRDLRPPEQLPNGIGWLYPQKEETTFQIVEQFFHKFYEDVEPRKIFLGINPGRFGAGITGVNFTAARQLKEYCGIEHSFKAGSELSAEFIYEVIHAYGGAHKFYSEFFIGSVCPLGFVKEGKNLNYYDDPQLLKAIEPFIIENLHRLLSFRYDREVCFCIGGEKNFKYLSRINQHYQWFKRIEPLPHPRFIMQYRRKQIPQFIQQYLQLITKSQF